MTSSDGERIAPVTYLFGASPSDERHEPAPRPSSDEEPHFAEQCVVDKPVASPVAMAMVDDTRSGRVQPERPQKRERFDPIENVSMYALARRGMSSREMREYLIGREFEAAEVEVEIERLERVQLLDDEALAETLVRALRERKGLGRSALNSELRRRKIDGVAIESSMASVGDDELERATEIALKRAPQLRSLDQATAKRRLGAFLRRKGYSGAVISAAISKALEHSAPQKSGGPVFR